MFGMNQCNPHHERDWMDKELRKLVDENESDFKFEYCWIEKYEEWLESIGHFKSAAECQAKDIEYWKRLLKAAEESTIHPSKEKIKILNDHRKRVTYWEAVLTTAKDKLKKVPPAKDLRLQPKKRIPRTSSDFEVFTGKDSSKRIPAKYSDGTDHPNNCDCKRCTGEYID